MRVLEQFETTSGTEWSKRQDTIGRTYYVKQGEGIIGYEGSGAGNRFAAAASHKPATAAFQRDEFEPSDVSELGHPFDKTRSVDIRQFQPGSAERFRAAETNRWLGFKATYQRRDDLPDDPVEIAEIYSNFRQEMREAESPEAKRDTERRYGVGGS